MGIKRCRGSEGEEGDSDIQMAMVFHVGRHGRVFECNTCKRQFPSFQALGGHRASHSRAQSAAYEGQQAKRPASPAQPKIHECAICGAEFAMGQSLGGHMRRHRAELESACGGLAQKTKKPKRAPLDLNLPPGEHIMMGDFLGLGFVGKVPLVC